MKNVFAFGMLLSLALISLARGGETIAWYQQPAKAWHEALPVGNGRIGAMVFGGVEKELLHFNFNPPLCAPAATANEPSAMAMHTASMSLGAMTSRKSLQAAHPQFWMPLPA